MAWFVSRWKHKIARFGRDSLSLSKAVYKFRATPSLPLSETIKAVLLKESRNHNNSVAISCLKLGKEIGLVRYWGLAEYLKQKQELFWSSSATTAITRNKEQQQQQATTTTTSSSAETTTSNTARVAFMITSSMKQELVDGLGYDANTIKAMTPQRASLVLHHAVPPESYDATISGLEEAFHEQQRQQQQQISQREHTTPHETKIQGIADTTTLPSTDAGSSDSLSKDGFATNDFNNNDNEQLLLASPVSGAHEHDVAAESSPSSRPEEAIEQSQSGDSDSIPRDQLSSLSTCTENDDPDGCWYEVVELKTTATTLTAAAGGDESSQVRHGLYRNKEEALLSLETRRMIQTKREANQEANRYDDDAETTSKTSFLLRPISEEELRRMS